MTKRKAMEFTFDNFQTEYISYAQMGDLILAERHVKNPSSKRLTYLTRVHNEFKNLDVKMRLAFGISEIKLNNEFVSDKEGDLKLCHLLYYKLADLWFAYETYIKLFEIVTGAGKNKIVWLEGAVHNTYANSQTVVSALRLVNMRFTETYDSTTKRKELIKYLEYCEEQAQSSQKQRLAGIIAKVRQAPFTLTHSEIMTIIYAVRNNFVHNGETTVVPNIFGYINKSKLLNILYPYLSLVLLNSTNITCRRVWNG